MENERGELIEGQCTTEGSRGIIKNLGTQMKVCTFYSEDGRKLLKDIQE
jgi:hypothetical protein